MVHGLTRKPDGRWRISATKKTFVEPDEALAVARFYELTTGETNRILLSSGSFPAGHPAIEDTARNPSVHAVTEPDGRVTLHETMNELEFFAAVRYQLLHNLDHVARMTGIPGLLQLQNEMPKPSPTLQELLDLYVAKPNLSDNEISRSKLFWKEFCKAIDVATVREITHDAVIRYEKKVLAGKYSPKSIHHRYGKVRTILLYAIKRGCGIEDCRRALDCTALLDVKNHTPLDPKPITPDQFWKIYAEVVKAGDGIFAALMLTALNAAMYGGEVSALKWEEVDMKTGEVVTRRPKTSVSRVCVLWPEVLAGLRKLAKQGDYIFYSARRYPRNAWLAAQPFPMHDLVQQPIGIVFEAGQPRSRSGIKPHRYAKFLPGGNWFIVTACFSHGGQKRTPQPAVRVACWGVGSIV